MLLNLSRHYPVGAHVIIRDTEWRITEVNHLSGGNDFRLVCVGLSDLIRGRKGIFFSSLENDIRLLLPEDTVLKQDDSPGFIKSKLFIEATIRSAPKTDNTKIYVGNKAAMDPLPYQFDPTIQALSQTKPRILIADAVGIGKTLEAGILTSELMIRGRARRILVVATKAMLLQFQQEFWNRFSIPLCRLDSVGIQRCINKIPTNKNPFDYFDKSIISVDTLKQNEFLSYLEKAHWDLIIIDEAHNVATRGDGRSQRARLANLLSKHSDSMIMLTATPHDGSSKSFASLLNILDPTAISDDEQYKADDFIDKGLVIRRFKADIREQIEKDFPQRKIETKEIEASSIENEVFEEIENLFNKEKQEDKTIAGHHLFSSILTKAIFSSPVACESVLKHRISRLKKKDNINEKEIALLNNLLLKVQSISVADFGKFNWLVKFLNEDQSYSWNKSDPKDRLVIFTESIPTLEFLSKELPSKLGLKDNQFASIHGGMQDSEISEKVNEFNKESSPIRLFICSDVASEGINLHHLSHRMIHFDLPWSLMTFQQRNGRIDRYGQTRQPYILYLQTIAANKKAKDDAYILERLQQKDEQAQINIDDPSEFIKTKDEQENDTFSMIEGTFETNNLNLYDIFNLDKTTDDEGKKTTKFARVMSSDEYQDHLAKIDSVFNSDLEYAGNVLKFKAAQEKLDNEKELYFEISEHSLSLEIDNVLKMRLPPEILPKNNRITLTDDKKLLNKEFELVRTSDEDWPAKQLLYPLHPVLSYLTDYSLSVMGRHTAPILSMNSLSSSEVYVLLQGGYPNRRGYTPVHGLYSVFFNQNISEILTFNETIEKLGLNKQLTNTCIPISSESLESYVRDAIKKVSEILKTEKQTFEAHIKKDLSENLSALESLKSKHVNFFNSLYADSRQKALLTNKQREIEENFTNLRNYMKDTAELENDPYIQIIAVIAGTRG